MKTSRWLVAGTGVSLFASIAMAAAMEEGLFTASQVSAGKDAYEANCMGCHQQNLAGQGDALPLVGKGFMLNWGNKTVAELYARIHDTMPYGMPRSLTEKTYTEIVAYILSQNRAPPGSQMLTSTNATRIGAVASGVSAQSANTISPAAAAAPTQPAPTPESMALMMKPATQAPLKSGDIRTMSGASGNAGSAAHGWSVTGDIKDYSDVTDQMLRSPAAADWIMYRGNYAGWSYSDLTQINTHNVDKLQLVWSWALAPGASLQTTPIVHDGIMFLWSPGQIIQAIDAATGNLLWENRLGPMPKTLFGSGRDGNRTLAVYRDKVFVVTNEARLYALNARTGEMLWQVDVGDSVSGFGSATAGAIVVNGKVLSGLTSCTESAAEAGNHCYISAYDADTGKREWKFDTIGLKGMPGGDGWNNLPDAKRSGGETWILGTYDPDLNTTYWGTAQAKPWRRDLRGSNDADLPYTSATLALNPDTGRLKWFFNHAPGETLDLDEASERMLIDDGPRKTVVTVGKPGILWKLNRETGQFVRSAPTILNNVSTVDRRTGVITLREDIVKQKPEDWLPSCPGPQGGHSWMPSSYYQPSNTLIIPLSQSCVEMLGNGSQRLYFMPGTDGMTGRLSAFDATTFEPKWTFQQRAPFLTGVLSTRGRLAFIGDYDRVFRAIDVATGDTLWKTRLGTSVQGHPITFSVNGRQYIAITAGLGGGSPNQKPMAMLPEINRPLQGNQIYVFALPDVLTAAH